MSTSGVVDDGVGLDSMRPVDLRVADALPGRIGRMSSLDRGPQGSESFRARTGQAIGEILPFAVGVPLGQVPIIAVI